MTHIPLTGEFKYWVQKVMPMVYDDSLSYYELLNKVVEHLNTVTTQVNEVTTETENALTAQDADILAIENELTNLIDNTLPDNLEVVLDEWYANGKLASIINTNVFDMKADKKVVGINPETYGLSEESLDNYQAIVDTLNEVKSQGGGKIIFPYGKTYKLAQGLGSHEISDIEIDFNGSTLDISGVPITNTDTVLMFSGSIVATYPLTDNVVEGTDMIKVDTTNIASGDMVKIYSSKIWDTNRTSSRVGEIGFVQSVDSVSQFTLSTPACDGYNTVDSGQVQVIKPVKNVVIKNGFIKGVEGVNELRGIRITRGVHCTIKNMRSYSLGVNHIQLTDCSKCTVTECFIDKSVNSAMAYGISFADACQDCIASLNHFTGVRHSLSTNNNVTTSWGVTRRILFTDNIINDSAYSTGGSGGDAVDTHAGAEDIFILNNIINGSSGIGINCEARSATIRGNRVRGTNSVGIQFAPYADKGFYRVEICGNKITKVGDAVGSDYGIQAIVRYGDAESVVITDNVVQAKSAGIRVLAMNGESISSGCVTGNMVKCDLGVGIDVGQSFGVAITGNNCTVQAHGITCTEGVNVTVVGNIVEIVTPDGFTAYGVRLLGVCNLCTVVANAVRKRVSAVVSAGSLLVQVSDTSTNNMVANNVSKDLPSGVALGVGAGNVGVNNIV